MTISNTKVGDGPPSAWHVEIDGGYLLSTDQELLDLAAVTTYLSEESYWARGRAAEMIERSIAASLTFGLYGPDRRQAGLTRVVGDGATFAWVCDVFVLADHQGRGLGKAMLSAMLTHPEVAGVRRLMLATADAHGLYAQFGFTDLVEPGRWMERRADGFELPPMGPAHLSH